MDENSRIFENTWAIVELMGHQVIAGQVTEVTVAGAPMLRVDVPEIAGADGAEQRLAFTKFFAPGALYGLTPTDEASARHAVEHLRARPISPYTIPERVRALPAPLFDVAAGDPDGEEVDP